MKRVYFISYNQHGHLTVPTVGYFSRVSPYRFRHCRFVGWVWIFAPGNNPVLECSATLSPSVSRPDLKRIVGLVGAPSREDQGESRLEHLVQPRGFIHHVEGRERDWPFAPWLTKDWMLRRCWQCLFYYDFHITERSFLRLGYVLLWGLRHPVWGPLSILLYGLSWFTGSYSIFGVRVWFYTLVFKFVPQRPMCPNAKTLLFIFVHYIFISVTGIVSFIFVVICYILVYFWTDMRI